MLEQVSYEAFKYSGIRRTTEDTRQNDAIMITMELCYLQRRGAIYGPAHGYCTSLWRMIYVNCIFGGLKNNIC